MAQSVPQPRNHIPLHPLLFFFNIIFNCVIPIFELCVVWFYCHFDLHKKAVCWIFVHVIICFLHFIILHFFIRHFFILKKKKVSTWGNTTFYSILYITIISIEFVWIIIGSVLYPRYTPEVKQPYFHIISLVCVIITWVKLLFLPSLFLTFLIIQCQRYRRYRKIYLDSSQQQPADDTSFLTGGCCACCGGDGEDRCCCCRCSCCEPRGVMASYILGEESISDEVENNDNWSEREQAEEGCCCCGKHHVDIEMSRTDLSSSQQSVTASQPVRQNVPAVQSINPVSLQSSQSINPIPIQSSQSINPTPLQSSQSNPIPLQPSQSNPIPIQSTQSINPIPIQSTQSINPLQSSQSIPLQSSQSNSVQSSQSNPIPLQPSQSISLHPSPHSSQHSPNTSSSHIQIIQPLLSSRHSTPSQTPSANESPQPIHSIPQIHLQTTEGIPALNGTPVILLPSSNRLTGQAFQGLHIVEAVADDGSGRKVYVALP